MASSVMLSLPRDTAPAARSRVTAVQYWSAVKYSAVRVPQEVGRPRMKQRSLNASGTPWSGPRHRPRPASSSRRRAAASARSAAPVVEGAEAILGPGDPIEVVARDLDRGDLALPDRRGDRGQAREVGQRR